MADTRPTAISPWRAAHLCITLLLTPERMEQEEERDDELRKSMGPAPAEPRHRAFIVRSAFAKSCILVAAFGLIGYAAGSGMNYAGRCATPFTVALLQIAGASLLLWGTLFIRGWEVQTYCGVSLTERVNQWLYRTLYCVGTAVIVYSLAFPSCAR